MTDTAPFPASPRLQANSVSWRGQFFQSMAHMAPAVAVIMTVQYMASRAGPAVPLATLFATVLALLLAYCLALLTRKFYGASGYFQIHSRALGSGIGFTTSWLFLMYEPFVSAITLFGYGVLVLEPFTKAALGHVVPWWAAFIVGQAVVLGLSLFDIKSSIRITAFLGACEFLIMLLLGVFLIGRTAHPIHPEYFKPSSSPGGLGGLLFSFIFGFMMFVGYESGLPLTEETAESKTAMFRSLIVSVVIAGLFYTFISYATVVGFGGAQNPAQFAKDFSGADNPYGGSLALKAFGGIGPWLIFLAATNSTLACCLASQNAAVRVFFALGRARILPARLARTTPALVPANAVWFAAAVSFVAGLFIYILCRHGSASDWFGFFGVLMTLPLLVIHFVTCVSVFMVYWRRHSGEFDLVRHGLLPVATGLMVLLPIWGAIYYNPAPPYTYAPWMVALWLLSGAAVYCLLRKKRPDALRTLESEMDTIRLDGPQI